MSFTSRYLEIAFHSVTYFSNTLYTPCAVICNSVGTFQASIVLCIMQFYCCSGISIKIFKGILLWNSFQATYVFYPLDQIIKHPRVNIRTIGLTFNRLVQRLEFRGCGTECLSVAIVPLAYILEHRQVGRVRSFTSK